MNFLDKILGLTEGFLGGTKALVDKISNQKMETTGSIWSEDEMKFYEHRAAEAAQKQADLTTIPGTPEDQGSEDEIKFYEHRAAEAAQKQADLTTIPGMPEDQVSEDEIKFYEHRAAEAAQKQTDLTTIQGMPEDKTDLNKD
ncbi:MAG: hypothetical protein PHX18_07640 [Candidatus Gastranaerophilales bacterium]|nr:hypothetical protein [Candidatus Gastranaerophilales bacterium]